jgi:hypothetical protein
MYWLSLTRAAAMQPSPVARVGEYPEFSAFFTWDGRALESPTVPPRCGPFETITLREEYNVHFRAG